jgi:predicted dienelactone hydrolase
MRNPIALIMVALGLLLSATTAAAGPIGQRRLTAVNPTAALRDAAHSDKIRVTVWYPAEAGAKETTLDPGPPGRPLFLVGSAAPDAAFADAKPRPVILFSHGFGGDARIMAWFALPLARAGYVVIAVDHPGNNADDPKTIAGSIMFWDRPGDLAAALAAAKADPEIRAHLDLSRLGVAGFPQGASPPSPRPARRSKSGGSSGSATTTPPTASARRSRSSRSRRSRPGRRWTRPSSRPRRRGPMVLTR